jgi:hypothetical protein
MYNSPINLEVHGIVTDDPRSEASLNTTAQSGTLPKFSKIALKVFANTTVMCSDSGQETGITRRIVTI